MLKNKAKTTFEGLLSGGDPQKLALWVAGTIIMISILLGIMISLRTPQYEAQARVTYTTSGSGSTAPTSGAPASLAGIALSDAQFVQLIERYDLYPEARKRQSTASLIGSMRERLMISSPEANVVQIAYRNDDQLKTVAVTNAMAGILTDYRIMTNIPAAASPVGDAASGRQQSRAARKQAIQRRTTPPAVSVPIPDASQPLNSSTAVTELSHQIDRVDAALVDMGMSQTELEKEQHQVNSKIEALEKLERRQSGEGHAGSQGDGTRSVTEQDLAAAKAKLAALKDRYTDAYPDVQTTEEEIANLQAKLARLPATKAEKMPVATVAQNEEMETLRQERQRIERDLERNIDSVQAETTRKVSLQVEMQKAGVARIYHPANPPAIVAAPQITAPAQPMTDGGIGEDAKPTAMITIPVMPFKLLETAGSAALVTTSNFLLGTWLLLGTILLLALCFVPMVPAHYAAVIKNPEDLKNNLPERITYLGDIGRIER